jgi:hypothetical protein
MPPFGQMPLTSDVRGIKSLVVSEHLKMIVKSNGLREQNHGILNAKATYAYTGCNPHAHGIERGITACMWWKGSGQKELLSHADFSNL